MKLIDSTAEQEKESQSKTLDSILGSLKLGRGSQDVEAQDVVTAAFQKLLDNQYFMLRNVTLPGSAMPIPLVLVGPPGVWVMLPSGLRGVYRAKGEVWEKLDDHKQLSKPTGDNLLTQTVQMAKAAETHLVSHNVQYTQVGSVLVFTNPGIHVETVRPVVRIVQIDALNRLITGIVQSRLVYDKQEVQKIVDLFTAPPESSPEQLEFGSTENDGFSLTDQARAESRVNAASAGFERIDDTFSKVNKLPFTSRQWLVLGLLILVNILVLAAFVVFIVFAN